MRFGKFFTSMLIVALLVGMSNFAYSQKTVKKYNQSITANPVALAFGLFSFTYEQQIAKENSFTAFGSYWSFGDWTAIGLGGSYRWYLFQEDKRALEGFSFGPMISIGFWSFANEIAYIDYDGGTSLAVGGEAAYKFVFDGGFSVEPIIQLNLNFLDISGLDYRPFSVGCNIGYAW